uniref:Uncharacterized protein n=1 Tax=Arundo donax TaxID=35708 RepID=A0A0A9EEC9_ARUDO
MNFPDIHAVWDSDFMDRSSIKDTFQHFSHPVSLLHTPCSQERTGLKLCRPSNKSFGFWNCENIDRNFRLTLDRFNNDSSIICEGTKHSDNFDYETEPLNHFNNDYCSTDKFGSEDDLTTWKSKFDGRLSADISPERSANGCHLNIPSSQMVNCSTLTQDPLNQQNYGCNQRSRPSKGDRSRSHSAPPFYRVKQKVSRLNEQLSKWTTDGDEDICINNQEDNAPTPVNISHMSATQPIPETDSSEFPNLNFRYAALAQLPKSTFNT